MYYDFYSYTHDLGNFERPFEITNTLVNSVNKDLLLGYNFNRYSEEGNDRRHHFTIRLNLANASQVNVVLGQLQLLQNNGSIDSYSNNNELVNTRFRDMSINHYLAHETSTKCAFTFYYKNLTSTRFREIWRDPITFLVLFLPRWLKYSQFTFQGVNNIMPTNIKCIEELAIDCGTITQHVDMDRITDFSIFIERLIHTFFNCVSNLAIEWEVRDVVASIQGCADFETLTQGLTRI